MQTNITDILNNFILFVTFMQILNAYLKPTDINCEFANYFCFLVLFCYTIFSIPKKDFDCSEDYSILYEIKDVIIDIFSSYVKLPLIIYFRVNIINYVMFNLFLEVLIHNIVCNF